MSDKTIALLLGLVAGMLLCCVATLPLLAAATRPAPAAPITPPADAVIEAALSEDYINRVFVRQALDQLGSLAPDEAQVDVTPGGRLTFVAHVPSPLGRLSVKGAVDIVVKDERLALRIAAVNLGQMPLAGLLRPLLPALESRLNDEANRQLMARAGPLKLRLIGVSSDETTLRFYLAAAR
jgi:hypothetical protein